jgi:hypothetical protein
MPLLLLCRFEEKWRARAKAERSLLSAIQLSSVMSIEMLMTGDARAQARRNISDVTLARAPRASPLLDSTFQTLIHHFDSTRTPTLIHEAANWYICFAPEGNHSEVHKRQNYKTKRKN